MGSSCMSRSSQNSRHAQPLVCSFSVRHTGERNHKMTAADNIEGQFRQSDYYNDTNKTHMALISSKWRYEAMARSRRAGP
jgi:hypothetical protein